MDIDTLLRDLGPVDSRALGDAILAQDREAWNEDQYRQQVFEVQAWQMRKVIEGKVDSYRPFVAK